MLRLLHTLWKRCRYMYTTTKMTSFYFKTEGAHSMSMRCKQSDAWVGINEKKAARLSKNRTAHTKDGNDRSIDHGRRKAAVHSEPVQQCVDDAAVPRYIWPI